MTYRHPDRTSFYHPYNFLLTPSQSERLFLFELEAAKTSGKAIYINDDSGNSLTYELLAWDSEFFGRPIYKIHFLSLTPNSSITHIEALLDKLCSSLHKPNVGFYFFIEVASEDLEVLETVSRRGWKLIETRLTYFNTDISVIGSTIQDQVRLATHDDIDELRNTAIVAKNHFDRFHSDSYFSDDEIDRFMGIFIENSVAYRFAKDKDGNRRREVL